MATVDEENGRWYQSPSPSSSGTFLAALIFFVVLCVLFKGRVEKLRSKIRPGSFRGSLRVSSYISAYMDNHGDSRFPILRLYTKALFFLGFMQTNFQFGFLIMAGVIVVESSLDTIRIMLAYRNCRNLQSMDIIADEEAEALQDPTKVVPTNVYEDLTQPKLIAGMVFVVQTLLIGLVFDDTYDKTTRPCLGGTGSCVMFSTLGSYTLYILGTFMACVFYVGPRNSYGQKEQNPTFWLKLFLMTKETDMTFSWVNKASQTQTIHLEKHDWHIWARFFMSFLINGFGFHFLLHVLPIQIASQSSVLGIVFRAVGMMYLVDLDDTAGPTLTPVPNNEDHDEESAAAVGNYGSLDKKKEEIVEEAMADIRTKLQTLVREEETPLLK